MTMTELLKGSLTLQTLPGEMLTIAALKDMHNRALMLGIPTHAEIWAVQITAAPEPNARQELTIHWRIPETVPTSPHQAGPIAEGHPYPTAQEAQA